MTGTTSRTSVRPGLSATLLSHSPKGPDSNTKSVYMATFRASTQHIDRSMISKVSEKGIPRMYSTPEIDNSRLGFIEIMCHSLDLICRYLEIICRYLDF